MKKIIKGALIIIFIVGISTFSYRCGILKSDEHVDSPQFQTIGLDFTIYTVRGHEYLGKDNFGLVHMVNCKACETANRIYTVRGHEYLGKGNLGLVHMADCKTCEIIKSEQQERLENLIDKVMTQLTATQANRLNIPRE